MKSAAPLIAVVLLLSACDDEVEQPTSPPRVQATPFVPAAPVPIPTRAPTPAPEPNDPPALHFSINPAEPSGSAPREVTVSMCGSTDPEGEPLVYQYKWGGGFEHFSRGCRASHVYDTPGSFHAFFCVYDEHDNRDCFNQRIDIITP